MPVWSGRRRELVWTGFEGCGCGAVAFRAHRYWEQVRWCRVVSRTGKGRRGRRARGEGWMLAGSSEISDAVGSRRGRLYTPLGGWCLRRARILLHWRESTKNGGRSPSRWGRGPLSSLRFQPGLDQRHSRGRVSVREKYSSICWSSLSLLEPSLSRLEGGR